MEKIPSPPVLPVIKSLPYFDVNAPVQSLINLSKEYGEIYRLCLPILDTIVVSSPKLIQQISDEKKFPKHVHGPLPFLKDFVGDGLFTADSHTPEWEKAHRILRSSFSPQKIQYYHNSMVDIVEQMMIKWERHGPSYVVDVSLDMTKVTLDIVSLCCFGYRFNSFYTPGSHSFLDALSFCLKEANDRPKRIPGTSLFFKKRDQKFQKNIETMHSLVHSVIRQRREQQDSLKKEDLLDFMLSEEDSVTQNSFTDKEILDQIMTFLIAGHETTSGVLAFAFYEILRNQEVLKKLQAEVNDVLEKDTWSAPTYEQIKKMKFLDSVVNETLRLWPTLPVYGVKHSGPFLLDNKWEVSPEQDLIVLLPSLHRNQEFWGEDSKKFKPERFKDLNPKDYMHAFQPWGRGRRSCLGRFFALHEIKLIIAMAFHRFDIKNFNESKQLEIEETLSIKPKGFYMSVSTK